MTMGETSETTARPDGSRPIPSLATFIFVATLAVLPLTRQFHDRTVLDIFFSVSLFSVTIVYLYIRPLLEVLQVIAMAAILAALQLFILRVPLRAPPVLALLGMSSLLLLGIRQTRSAGTDRDLLGAVFMALLFSFVLGYLGSTLLWLTGELHPKPLDFILYSFDASLGTQLSFKTGQMLWRLRGLARITRISYYALPIPLTLVFAMQIRNQGIKAWRVLIALSVAMPLGVIFYNLLPACGPFYLVGVMFPRTPPSVQQAAVLLSQVGLFPGARNAFPSLHMAWALLAWWYSKGLSSWARSFFFMFVALTVLATLGLGEHYFIDLVAAFPFALLVEALFALQVPIFDRRRAVPLLSSLAMMLAWITLLRCGLPAVFISPLIPWMLIICTVLACLALEPWLQYAADCLPSTSVQTPRPTRL